MPQVDRLGRRREDDLAPADRQPAAVVRREAGKGPRQLLAARPDDSGDAQNLALDATERDIPICAGERQPIDLQGNFVEIGLLQRLAVVFGLQAAADHQLMQPRDVGVPARGSATTAPSFIT